MHLRPVTEVGRPADAGIWLEVSGAGEPQCALDEMIWLVADIANSRHPSRRFSYQHPCFINTHVWVAAVALLRHALGASAVEASHRGAHSSYLPSGEPVLFSVNPQALLRATQADRIAQMEFIFKIYC